jgi:hypothetical protein
VLDLVHPVGPAGGFTARVGMQGMAKGGIVIPCS